MTDTLYSKIMVRIAEFTIIFLASYGIYELGKLTI
jgi:hypothetical protein